MIRQDESSGMILLFKIINIYIDELKLHFCFWIFKLNTRFRKEIQIYSKKTYIFKYGFRILSICNLEPKV